MPARIITDPTKTSSHPITDLPLKNTIPIPNIKVHFPPVGIGRIHLEPGNITLPASVVDNTLVVTVPPLDIHAMVIAELGSSQADVSTMNYLE